MKGLILVIKRENKLVSCDLKNLKLLRNSVLLTREGNENYISLSQLFPLFHRFLPSLSQRHIFSVAFVRREGWEGAFPAFNVNV